MDAAWVTAAASLALAVGGLLVWCGRWAWRILREVSHFLDDWRGEPARSGMAARPGVLARLASLEDSVTAVRTEVSPNHGKSIRDVIHQTKRDVDAIKRHIGMHS
jgi:hypothetical protein